MQNVKVLFLHGINNKYIPQDNASFYDGNTAELSAHIQAKHSAVYI